MESLFNESETYYLQLLDSLRHQEVSMLQFTNLVFRFCDCKFPFTEEHLLKLASLANEKLISESPLKEILCSFDTTEFRDQLIKHQFNYDRFFIFCRYLCRSDKQGFDILAHAFFKEPWQNNAYFQLGFIKYCIDTCNVDEILSKCTHERNQQLLALVPQIELLKSQPDFEKDKSLLTWKYQCMYRILTALSEIATLQSICEEILFTPLNKCPDLLVLGLLEVEPQQQGLKGLFLLKAIIKFIDPTQPNYSQPNASQIFQKLWPSDFNQTSLQALSWTQRVLIQAMIELYTMSSPGEQQAQRLKQILDLSQDLKALNFLLSTNSCMFVIDLACLASRREYLKLDKWLNDKIAKNIKNGQSFMEACINFLRARCPVFGGKEQGAYPAEIYRLILECLKHCINFESPKTTVEVEIVKMYKTYVQWQPMTGGNAAGPYMNPVKPNQFDSNWNQSGQQAQQANAFNPNQLLSQVRAAAGGGNQINNATPGAAGSTGAGGGTSGGAPASYFPDIEQQFSKEVEDEADSYFQKIYNQDQPGSMSLDEILDMLGKFKDSMKQKEKDVFSCMIRNLFKEFPFLSQYPDKELLITGEIFGGIIFNDFVKGFQFIAALRMILESLKKTPDSRLFMFGKAALDKFKTRLKEFPQFSQHLTNIPHFSDFPPDLALYIEYGKHSVEPPEAATTNGLPPSATLAVSGPVVPSAKKTSTSSAKDLATPPEVAPPNAFQDKISFIINNLSALNLTKKSDEFKDVVNKAKEIYRQWVAHYFVMKRVSLEANFHELYSNFLVRLNMPILYRLVLDETYRNIRSLLRSYRDADNINDRTVLKNLGQWLGLVTLAQNRPILSIELDLRNLLIEAYHKGLLHLYYVVPFVAKVLHGVAKSKVFRPPNPWTVSLIFILADLHSIPDVKLNMKFEVEVLCKFLEIDLNDYRGRAETLLKSKEMPPDLEPQLGNYIMVPHPQIGGTTVVAETVPETPAVAGRGEAVASPGFELTTGSVPPVSASPVTTIGNGGVGVHSYADVNPAYLLRSLTIQANLSEQVKEVIKHMIQKTVTEWTTTISEKMMKVAMATTETLVKKDFPIDTSAELMRSAAQNTLRCLVAGYSLISTKEPLANRLASQLTHLLQAALMAGNNNREMEVVVNNIVSENIDLCVCVVEKLCIERTLPQLEARMKADFDQRQAAGYAESIVGGQIEALPENLRHRFGVITQKQMAIYEEMGRNLPGFVPLATPPGYSVPPSPQVSTPASAAPPVPMPFKATGAPATAAVAAAAHPSIMLHEGANTAVAGNVVSGAGLIGPANGQILAAANANAAAAAAVAAAAGPNADAYAMIYDRLIKHMGELLADVDYNTFNSEILQSVGELLKSAKQNPREQAIGLSLIKSAVNGLRELILNFQEGATDFSVITRVRDFYLLLLKALTDQRTFNNRFTSTHVTRCVMDQWISMNPTFPDDLFDALSRSSLINYQFMDGEFYQLLESCQTYAVIPIILQFLKVYIGNGMNPNLFSQTLDLLKQIHLKISNSNVQNTQLLNDFRAIYGLAHVSDFDLNTFIEKVKVIIGDWITCYNSGKNVHVSFQLLVKHMSIQGLLKNDESISRFFKIFLELVVENCNHIFTMAVQHPTVTATEVHMRCYEYIDSFTVLTLLFVKQSGGTTNLEQKYQFLQRILMILSSTCFNKHEAHAQHGKEFHPLIFYRILIIIFVEFFYAPFNLGLTELMVAEVTPAVAGKMQYETFKISMLKGYTQLLHILAPLKAPAFAYAWYDLVSHRVFIGKLLENSKTWELYFMILCDMLAFQKAVLATEAKNDFYKVTVKLFLVLYHDFPDFLVEYCYHFCSLLPHRAINLRNIILSAIPMNKPLPDPVKVSIKMEAFHEIVLPFLNIPMPSLSELSFRKELDNYMVNRQPVSFLNDLRACLMANNTAVNATGGEKASGTLVVYNVPLLDAMTLYIGLSALQSIKQITVATVANTPHMDVFQGLFMTFDSQGRYHLINSIVDHLRYPNTETLFYLCTILSLFNDSTDQLREQIVRVLLERILARVPHPWGLKYLLAELIRNPSYKLLEHNFVKGVPEVEKILVNNFQEAIGASFEQIQFLHFH